LSNVANDYSKVTKTKQYLSVCIRLRLGLINFSNLISSDTMVRPAPGDFT